MAKKAAEKPLYENNPFFVPIQGAAQLFELARGVTVILILWSVISSISPVGDSSPTDPAKSYRDFIETVNSWSAEEWITVVSSVFIIGLAWLLISSLFSGVSAYTAARLSHGHSVRLREAFRVSFDNLWSYVLLQILIFVKIVLWSLLFIIPGIVMAFRYSLAGVVFYDDKKKKRGNAAIAESVKLTKNGWMTTFASNLLLTIVTFGVLSSLISAATNTTLYKQFNAVGDKKPKAHWLSWAVTIFFGIAAFATFIYWVV